MTNKVWMLESGDYSDYSDYHIVGIFSSEENAQRAINALGKCYGEPTIREMDLDPHIEDMNSGLKPYIIRMDYSGVVERLEQEQPSTYDFETRLTIWRRTKAFSYKGKRVNDAIKGYVWAKDRKHAIKITNEQRAQAIAERRMHEAES